MSKDILDKLVATVEDCPDMFDSETAHFRQLWEQIEEDASLSMLFGYAQKLPSGLDEEVLCQLSRLVIHEIVRRKIEEKSNAVIELEDQWIMESVEPGNRRF
jgi:hypothetical protein